jgi:hypothetical protein
MRRLVTGLFRDGLGSVATASAPRGKIMHRLIATLTLLLASAYSWGQATIGFDLSAGDTFTAGQTVTLDLVGNGWTAQDLAGGGLDLVVSDSSVFSLQSVTVDTSVFDVPFGNCDPSGNCAASPSGATSIDFGTFLNSAPSGTFDIASFTFLALNTGTANLDFSADCACSFSNSLGTQLIQGVDFNLQNASVSVVSPTAAPEIDASSSLAALTLLLGAVAILRARLPGAGSRAPLG